MTDEPDEQAKAQLSDVEEEMEEVKRKLAGLREQWEAEKLGLGDVQQVRDQLAKVELEFTQLEATIKEKQSRGEMVTEDEYQRLFELDNQRKQFNAKLEAEESESEKPDVQAGESRRLLRQEVGPEEIAEVVSAWTGNSHHPDDGDRTRQAAGDGRPLAFAGGRTRRSGRGRLERRPPQP